MKGPQVNSRIAKLKTERGAVILAHSYQPPVIQDLADFVGDSLELSRKAASAEEPVIVFCGVRFMAETAHILAPEKTVILPEPLAGCPLADCIDAPSLRSLQAVHPEALTVLYVNSPADAKAESYACCTSANALDVVQSVPSEEVIFAPDRNLGEWIARRTDKTLHVWNGACRPHSMANLGNLRQIRAKYPDALVLVHPETPPGMWELADEVLGTGGMIRFVDRSECRRFIIGTEEGMVYRLSTLFPDREFRSAGGIFCPNMKVITPEKVLSSLQTLTPSVELDPEVRSRAFAAVSRMTEMGG